MKLNIYITLTILSGMSLASLLTGCTIPTKEDIARSTTEFNLVAERAGNEMLLLNIIRASKRRPMYFTSIGTLRRSMNFEYGTGGVSIPFGRIGGGLDGSYSIAPSAGYRDTPLLDVSVLDTKEFTNGIMMPVPMETIEYYWSQGWHPEMLLHLFIRRIEIRDPKDPNIIWKEYVNYPGDKEKFDEFQEQIRKKNWEWGIKKDEVTSIGEVDVNEASQLKSLLEAQKAGLTLTPVKNNKMKFCLNQVNYNFTRKATPDYEKRIEKMPKEKKELLEKMKESHTFGTTNSSSDKKDKKVDIKVYLRSPEAILYYLGEIVRAEHSKDPNTPMIYTGFEERKECPARLFYVCKTPDKDDDSCISVDDACLSVVYGKTRYFIPKTHDIDGCCTDRSMHVLSLVSLLIGQQKESKLVPTTGVVSVIGR